jgi:Plasmid pRiA4b ORF-3-like protein
MAAYRFKVTLEGNEDVLREIEIKSYQTFESFHHAIQQSVGFDIKKTASFFMSTDTWKKGQEISNRSPRDNDSTLITLEKARLCDFITDPHQKIYHEYDSNWSFYIELLKIVSVNPDTAYPQLVSSIGKAPKQYPVIEPPKGTKTTKDSLKDEILLLEEEEVTDEEGDNKEEKSDNAFEEVIDKNEFDSIEDRSSNIG